MVVKFLTKSLRFFVVFTLIFSWIFSGWPENTDKVYADQTTKTYVFDSTTESWSATSCGAAGGVCGHEPNDGSPSNGSIEEEETRKNKGGTWTWQLSGITWESMGVPSGATVTNVDGSYNHTMAVCTSCHTTGSNTSGTLLIRDSGDTATVATLETAVSYTGASAWAARNASGAQSVGASYQASNTGIILRITGSIQTNNVTGAVATIRQDQISFVITYTPAVNARPTASSVSIDSGAASITLTENTTKSVSCVGTATDTDGFADITSVTADLYRTSVGTSTQDTNFSYRLSGDAQCVPSGGSGNSETYTCAFSVEYYADPTDAGSPNASDTWSCTMAPSDAGGQGPSAVDTIEMNSLIALDVTSSINYGTVNANTDTEATNQTTTVTNTGNRDMDPQLSGTDMTGGGTIAVAQQKYSDTAFTYSGGGTALSTTPTTLNITLPQRTSTAITDDVFWGLGVPNGTPAGAYTGTNTFSATAGI